MKLMYRLYEKKLWSEIKNFKNPPHHLAIILDGNRRYARKIGKENKEGHDFGVEKLKHITRWVWEADIKILTIYAFSSENFSRPEDEIKQLMQIFRENFLSLVDTPEIHTHKVRIKAIGRISELPKDVQAAIHKAEESTAAYNERLFQIAIGYTGRAEVIDAIRGIVRDKIDPDQISEETVSKYLYTNGAEDPDLIIRTSGEERLSGFLLWQSAYSELYFADVYFPEFRKIDLWRAIRTFQHRDRRFGK